MLINAVVTGDTVCCVSLNSYRPRAANSGHFPSALFPGIVLRTFLTLRLGLLRFRAFEVAF